MSFCNSERSEESLISAATIRLRLPDIFRFTQLDSEQTTSGFEPRASLVRLPANSGQELWASSTDDLLRFRLMKRGDKIRDTEQGAYQLLLKRGYSLGKNTYFWSRNVTAPVSRL